MQRIRSAESDEPPNNCSVCLLLEQRNAEKVDRRLKTGVAWHGVNYHIHDFVLIKAELGPCHIGQITHIQFSSKSRSHELAVITAKLLGRICTIGALPSDIERDEVGRPVYWSLASN